jgi:OOP family OmpA-OmpF porin
MRSHRTALLCFAAPLLLAAADGALAQQYGNIRTGQVWYLGAGAGVSYYDLESADRNAIPSITTMGFDSTGFGWKIFGGYRFNPYFGLEGSYVDLGDTSGGLKYAMHSWNIAGVGRVPFGTGFFLQGKVGAAFTRAQSTPFGQTVGSTHYKTNVLVGAGFGYDFANGFTLLGEAEWYGKTGDPAAVDPTTGLVTGTGRTQSYLFSASGLFRF